MTMLQVRNISAETHRELKARAARRGQSLSAYVAGELDRVVAQPTLDEFFSRIHARGPIAPAVPAVDVLHAARAERSCA